MGTDCELYANSIGKEPGVPGVGYGLPDYLERLNTSAKSAYVKVQNIILASDIKFNL